MSFRHDHAALLSCPPPASSSLALVVLNHCGSHDAAQVASSLLPGLWASASTTICADGAANLLFDHHPTLTPAFICGDLDSIRNDVADHYRTDGRTQIVHLPNQNHTDLHKCLCLLRRHLCGGGGDSTIDAAAINLDAEAAGATEVAPVDVVIYGAFDGRFDHEMGVIHCARAHHDRFRSIVMLSDTNLTCLLGAGRHAIRSSPRVVSCGLIPIMGPVDSVTTDGLHWDLCDRRLEFGHVVSIANRPVADVVNVRTSSMCLWTSTIARPPPTVHLPPIYAAIVDDARALDALRAAVHALMTYRVVEAMAIVTPYAATSPCLSMFADAVQTLAGQAAPSLSSITSSADAGADDVLSLHRRAVHLYGRCGRRAAAIRVWQRILSRHPDDIMTLKFVTMAAFYVGDTAAMREACQGAVMIDDADRHHLDAMHAFALIQCRRIGAGHRLAVRALTVDDGAPWAVHALMHAHWERGDHNAGLDLCDRRLGGRRRGDDFGDDLSCHLYWHWALFAFESDRAPLALRIFDQHLIPAIRRSRAYPMEVADAVSLLWRLQLVRHNCADQWATLRDVVAAHHPIDFVPVYNFTAAHFLVYRCHAHVDDPEAYLARALVGRPDPIAALFRALCAHCRGVVASIDDDDDDGIGMAPNIIYGLGGSFAQLDVFDMARIVDSMRADPPMARHQIRARLQRFPGSIPTRMLDPDDVIIAAAQ